MPSSYTPNYNLNQWEAGDRVLRTDFNADNAKIDAALGELAGRARFAAGHYDGDGQASRIISVGFTPKAVLVIANPGQIYTYDGSIVFYGGLSVTGHPMGNGTYSAVEVVNGGFKVFCLKEDRFHVQSNRSGTGYNYIALG